MGKLIEKLNRVTKSSAPRMGFASAAVQKQPTLSIIAALDKADKDVAKAAIGSGADAIVVMKTTLPAKVKTAAVGPLHQALGTADSIPCGGDISETPATDTASWDFALVGKTTTIEDANLGENVDKVLWLAQPPSIELLQTLESLPVDAIAMDARNQMKPLTVEGLSAFYRVANATRKPLLACTTLAATQATLVALRDAGVSGIITEFASPLDAKKLEALRQSIMEMPAKKQKRSDSRASLPLGLMTQSAPPAAPEREEDDDE